MPAKAAAAGELSAELACIADRAMAELKERRVKVDAELAQWLDYWVRTGEPRLAARRC